MRVPRESGDEPGLAFFAPDLTELSTIKRVSAFLDNRMNPLVLSFRRERCNRDYQPSWPHVPLGYTRDSDHRQRLWALVAAIPRIVGVRRALAAAPVFYARNLDLLLLALFARLLFNPSAAIVYEVLDIQPAFLGAGLKAAALRWIERRCLARVRLLVVSSPGFVRHYYVARQGYVGRWFLAENKLHRSALDQLRGTARRARGPGAPWVVGYFGLIRGAETMRLVRRVAEQLGSKVLFRFRGVFTTIDEARFHDLFDGCGNVVYEGEYANPKDLAAIYAGVDFAWAIDLEDAEHNSRWLLPNRFYEAGICGVPCLSVADFELGVHADRLGVGWSFADPLRDSVVKFFEHLTRDEYETCRGRLEALPRGAFVADADSAALCNILRTLWVDAGASSRNPAAAAE